MLMQVAFIGVLTAGLVSCAYNDEVLPLPAFGLGMTSDEPVPEGVLFTPDPSSFASSYIRDLINGKSDQYLVEYHHPSSLRAFQNPAQMFEHYRDTLDVIDLDDIEDLPDGSPRVVVRAGGQQAELRLHGSEQIAVIHLERFRGRWGVSGIDALSKFRGVGSGREDRFGPGGDYSSATVQPKQR